MQEKLTSLYHQTRISPKYCTKMERLFTGLCGDAIIAELGGMSCLFPYPQSLHTLSFAKIVKEVFNNYSNGLIIGASICVRESGLQFGEVYILESIYSFM